MSIKNGVATGVLAAVIGLGTNAVTSPSNTSNASQTGCTQATEQSSSTNGGGSSATATATSSSTSSSSGLLTVSNVANDVVDVNDNQVLNNNNVLSNNLNGNSVTVTDVVDVANVTTTVTDTVDILSPLGL